MSSNQLRYAVKDLYKNLIFMGKEYPLGEKYFRDRCHRAFMKNKDVKDEEKIKALIKQGKFVMRELEALYMLRKYRAMNKMYPKTDKK